MAQNIDPSITHTLHLAKHLKIRMARIVLTALCISGLVASSLPVQPVTAAPLKATFTVNTTADTIDLNPGNGTCADSGSNCSLRAAIMEANANGIGNDTITLPAGTFVLTRTNTGGINEDESEFGDLDINSSLTLQGAGPGSTFIQAGTDSTNGIDKVFGVNPYCANGINVTISGVTIRYGRNTQAWGLPDYSFTGGGVDWCGGSSTESFSLTNSVISDNTNVNGYGGGLNVDTSIGNTGTVTINNVTFQNNHTLASGTNGTGGGVNIFGYAPTVIITNSTFTNNSTTTSSDGGALFFRPGYGGIMTLTNSTFTGNSARNGGAVYLTPSNAGVTIGITNSQISNNTASANGGGLFLTAAYTTTTPYILSNLLISGNSAGQNGGGIYSNYANSILSHSRIVNNTAGTSGPGLFKDTSPGPAGVIADNNWWGCSTDPSAAPCNQAVTAGGPLDTSPWLRNQVTSSVSPVAVNQSTTISASYLTNSDNTAVSVANLEQIINLPVTWNATLGTLSGTQTAIQPDGRATGTFQATGAGTAVIYARVDSDNTTPVSSNVLSLTVNKADTTTAITSDTPDPSQVNAAVTVNYTVTGAYGNSPTAPTGNVTVTDGVDSCIGTAAAGTCNITLTTTGARTLTATYAGDANFNGSTSTGVAHTVNQPLTITSANNASFRVGSAGTFTVTTISSVTPSLSVSGTLPAGVGFTDNANGTATLTGTPAAGSTGTYNLVITANNGVNPNATQNFTLTVTQAPGITSANATSFSVGSAGSFTVTTSGYPTGASMLITETGSLPAGVTFVDNGNGTATLSGTPTAGSAGTYPLTIKSSNGVSPEATQSFSLGVNRVATTTSLTSDLPDPSVTGQSVTFSYAVNSASGTPTGNVTVSDGTNNCTGTVAAGSCDITFTNPGTANFTGTYAGDGTFIGSTSTTLSHTNNKANTVTDIASDTPDPSIVGEAVTVSYSVTVTAPGTGTPTGNVTVTDGTDSCTASVAAGSCTIAFSSKGTKSLQATYAGDTGFNTSTSSSQSHTVNMASTTTAITSDSPDPSVAGNSLAVNYSVTVASPGGGTPTGNVTVSDGVNSCTGTPAAGTCNLTLSTIGNRSLTATYAGDGNYANSMSSIEPHIVQGPPGVSLINSVADTGDGQVVENEHTSAAITALRVVFNKDINADTPADLNDALNLANYRLARSGNPDITIISAAYSNNGGAGPYIIDLGLIGGTALVDGHYTLTVNGRIEDTLGAPIGPDFVRNFFTDTQPIQIGTNGVILPNGTVIVDGSTLNASISEIRVAFNEDASNPANNTDPKDVTNPDNYLLIRPGPNAAFDTVSCNAGLAGDDIQVPTGPVVYSNGSGSGPYVARVTVNNGTPLGIGWYRLLVCGTTSITDLAGNVLNSGADSQLSFLVSSRSASGRGSGSSSDSEYKNPATGFAPVVTTTVPPQPADSQYSDLGDLWIELPTRGIQTSITGVPLQSNSWDLTWLDHQVGWLEGTAFPTWEGNTVLTAHNYAPDGTAGPFAGIKELKYDAPIIIHNHGMVYTYGVRMNSTVEANNSYWLNKHEDLDWVTLITCEQYDEHTHSYRYRQVVRAVLIKVEKEG